MSFYFFLSVFPILLILTGTLGLFLDANSLVRDSLLDRIGSVAPPSVVRLLDRFLEHLTGNAQPLGWGIGLTLWAASSGMTATIRGLNVAYGVEDERAWWKRRLVALGLTLVLMLLLATAMLLLAYGRPLVEMVVEKGGLGSSWVMAGRILQWPMLVGFLLFAFELVYQIAPHRPAARWRGVRAGSWIAAAMWLLGSILLKYYATNMARYNLAYGSIGAVVVLLLWFYWIGIAILVGAEVDASRQSAPTAPSAGLRERVRSSRGPSGGDGEVDP